MDRLQQRIPGRTLARAAVVGVAGGLLGALFLAALELAERLLLEGVAGYAPIRAAGEQLGATGGVAGCRLWALALLPALGALASGLLTSRFAPEAAGGGGDAIIASYHHGALVRRRVLAIKGAAAVATLASGGSGGREGPTMHLGGALGAIIARALSTSPRERRVLLLAGIAAGIAAVFRTPLGAALLATELQYRDDMEAGALAPAIVASLVSYVVAIALLGEARLFGALPRFPLVPAHLPLYAALAVLVALAGSSFLATLRAVQRLASRSGLPAWARPALGGLAMGGLGALVALAMASGLGPQAAGVGVFGGGYGVAQAALSGAVGLPAGWKLVGLFAALGAAKMIATSLTIGSGGAAGDFAPSLVMGGLVGAAFGEAAALLLGDPRLQPAAFALVGMAAFYGGIAHAPLAAAALVCELSGCYELLVPMLIAVFTALAVLRTRSLYPAQPAARAATRLDLGVTPGPP